MNTPAPPLIEPATEHLAALAAARTRAPEGQALVVWHLGPQTAWLAMDDGRSRLQVLAAPLGSEQLARTQFRLPEPTALEVENAIAEVEDAVMPLRRWLPDGGVLFSVDADVPELAALAGLHTPELSTEQLETVFNRWVARVQGRPWSQDPLPRTARFAVHLLVLRELMHHLGYVQVRGLP